MSTPRFVDCKCGHPRAAHPERLEEACSVDSCGCEEYRPVGGKLPTARVDRASVDDLLTAGERSTSKRIAALATKIRGLLLELRQRLDTDAEAAQARAEVAELERKLAAAKAKLRNGRTPPSTQTPAVAASGGDHECVEPDCDRTFATAQARAMHHRRAHQGWGHVGTEKAG